MSAQKRVVDSVTLYLDCPTTVTFAELYTWVIWQFPRRKSKGLCGAVRPPIAGHTWFPALIKSGEDCIIIHAHLDELFDTPEAAVERLSSSFS